MSEDNDKSTQDVSNYPSPNTRYSARSTCRSLENTNVRYDESTDDSSDKSHPIQSRNLIEEDVCEKDEGNDSGEKVDAPRTDSSMGKQWAKEYDITTKKNTRQFEAEKSFPWQRMIPADKNLSKHMFLYLTHKELQSKIEDLTKREMQACTKHSWYDALRLRDMKNKLELIREKELYNTEDLDIDDESRKTVFTNIYKREAELNEREKVCVDMTMYSEDAETMWKKWAKEDESFLIEDARLQREKLMESLEKEWQSLAVHDKERIARLYQSVDERFRLARGAQTTSLFNVNKI
ncbi:uncharacterized protein LOC143432484 [Xylocopa sonorina]|uniref:uncharacterized protein LOC143432484 n=1 Tax=Xylocopa sonorina TaxID=1818115 RepID=UPI00403B2AA9